MARPGDISTSTCCGGWPGWGVPRGTDTRAEQPTHTQNNKCSVLQIILLLNLGSSGLGWSSDKGTAWGWLQTTTNSCVLLCILLISRNSLAIPTAVQALLHTISSQTPVMNFAEEEILYSVSNTSLYPWKTSKSLSEQSIQGQTPKIKPLQKPSCTSCI